MTLTSLSLTQVILLNAEISGFSALFVREFQKVFNYSIKGGEAASWLLSLQQEQRSAADYSIDFRMIAAGSGWNDISLKEAFYRGLNETIKDKLAAREEAESQDVLIFLATKLDSRLIECGREKAHLPDRSSRSSPVTSDPRSGISHPSAPPLPPRPVCDGVPEPMELGGARLTQAECQRRMTNKECL